MRKIFIDDMPFAKIVFQQKGILLFYAFSPDESSIQRAYYN